MQQHGGSELSETPAFRPYSRMGPGGRNTRMMEETEETVGHETRTMEESTDDETLAPDTR